MYPPVFTSVSSDAAVQAVLGTNPVRVFPFGSAPDNATPYAVWQVIGGIPENYITNTPDIDSFVTQIDVYGDTSSETRDAAEALRDALENVANVISWRGEGKDENTDRFRYSFDVEFLTAR